MMEFVNLMGYVGANLGDDLFFKIICSRYPNLKFKLVGEKKLLPVYRDIDNLDYFVYDTLIKRAYTAFVRLYTNACNKVCRRGENQGKYILSNDSYWKYVLSKKAKATVLITGSGFRNEQNEDCYGRYREDEMFFTKKYYIIGCNFGPYYYDEFYSMYKELFGRVADVCFRDNHSYNLFRDLDNVRYAPDIILSYPQDELPAVKDDNYMLVSVANLEKDNDKVSNYLNTYVESLRRLVIDRNSQKKQTVLVGFSNEQGDDVIIKTVLDGIYEKNYNTVYCYPEVGCDEILKLFAGASSIVATRFHAIILGILFGKSICPISYSDKTKNFIKDITEKPVCIELDELDKITTDDYELNRQFTVSESVRKKLIMESSNHFAELDKFLRRTGV